MTNAPLRLWQGLICKIFIAVDPQTTAANLSGANSHLALPVMKDTL
ncbi:hypothetical protein [Rhizobium sp. FY34]|nr:hypothetical protein [Rhizobium sp. FY34]